MPASFDAVGRFWFPDDEKPVRGSLSIDETGGTEVALEGALQPHGEAQREGPVWGALETGHVVTLASWFASVQLKIDAGWTRQVISCDSLVIGAHVRGVDAKLFDQVVLAGDDLNAFADTSGLSYSLPSRPGVTHDRLPWTVEWNPDAGLCGLIDDAEIRVDHRNGFTYDSHWSFGLHDRTVWTVTSRTGARSISDWKEPWIGLVQSLASLSLDRSAEIRTITLRLTDPPDDDEDTRMVSLVQKSRPALPRRGRDRRLFTLRDLPDFASSIEGYLRFYEQIAEPRRFLLEIVMYGSALPFEDRLRSYAAFIEAYHRERLEPPEPDLLGEWQERVAEVLRRVGDLRDWVYDQLPDEPVASFRSRLRDVIICFESLEIVTGNRGDFIDAVVTHRNRFTHMDASRDSRQTGLDELVHLVDTVGLLCRACVLREMRLANNHIGRLIDLYVDPPPPMARRPPTYTSGI